MAAKWILLFVVLCLSAVSVVAQETWNGIEVMNIDLLMSDWSVKLILGGSILIAILTIIALKKEKTLKHRGKLWLFLGIAIPAILISLFIATSTIFVNVLSHTGGPVHWHADFEVYTCGEEVNLFEPSGLSNRIGTPKLHEHGDRRLHVEGTVVRLKEISLGAFFEVIGGHLDMNSFSVLTDTGMVTTGDGCNGEPAEVQVFLYEILNPDSTKSSGFLYQQRKLENFEEHILSPYFNVPPGDCLIVEYGPTKERTEHICETYKIGIEQGDLTGS